MFDQTDVAILKLLQENSRSQWKQIGEKVHLTGQAVAARVQSLQDSGLITGFTVSVNPAKLGQTVAAFITVFMNSSSHEAFRAFVAHEASVTAAHRVSGEGCYWLKATLASHEELTRLLDAILRYGNYRVSLSLEKIK